MAAHYPLDLRGTSHLYPFRLLPGKLPRFFPRWAEMDRSYMVLTTNDSGWTVTDYPGTNSYTTLDTAAATSIYSGGSEYTLEEGDEDEAVALRAAGYSCGDGILAAYRFRTHSSGAGLDEDTGWAAAVNAPLTGVNVDGIAYLRLRILLQNVGNYKFGWSSFGGWYLKYRINGGPWLTISSSGAVRPMTTSAYHNGQSTTVALLGGTGTWYNGSGAEGVSYVRNSLPAGLESEGEWTISLWPTNLSDGDLIEFSTNYYSPTYQDGVNMWTIPSQLPSISVVKT